MSTKNNPGAFDCYAKLEPDEPYFLLRGKDPSGALLVEIWVAMRHGDFEHVKYLVHQAEKDVFIRERVSDITYEKLKEATETALAMSSWASMKRRERIK